ncbi:MAG TPA: hypothetical protein VNN25_02700 [Thermoanaerobaculia bacterium]|nr:hypothetical protein [Thermoanaerobaculia bacterium]
MESFEDRLRRFVKGADREFALTIFMMVRNALLIEVEDAAKKHLLTLTLLGTHAAMQMVCEKVFGLKGIDATEFYLEQFVDGTAPDRKYSAIVAELHEQRNVMAHQGFSSTQHVIAYDWGLSGGFEWKGNTLHLNPDIYIADFIAGAARYSKVATTYVTDFEMAKRKYAFIRDWLDLPKGDSLDDQLKNVKNLPDLPALRAAEPPLQDVIVTKYGLYARR